MSPTFGCSFRGEGCQQPGLFLSSITINKAGEDFYFSTPNTFSILFPPSSHGGLGSAPARRPTEPFPPLHPPPPHPNTTPLLLRATPKFPHNSLQSFIWKPGARPGARACAHTLKRKHSQSQRGKKNIIKENKIKPSFWKAEQARVIPGSGGLGDGAEGRRLQSIKLPLRTCQTDNSWKELNISGPPAPLLAFTLPQSPARGQGPGSVTFSHSLVPHELRLEPIPLIPNLPEA